MVHFVPMNDEKRYLTFWTYCGTLWTIRFIKIKSDLINRAFFGAEKKNAKLPQGGLQQNPFPPPRTLRSNRKDDRTWVMTKRKLAVESAEAALKRGGHRNDLRRKQKFLCSSFAHWKKGSERLAWIIWGVYRMLWEWAVISWLKALPKTASWFAKCWMISRENFNPPHKFECFSLKIECFSALQG